MASFNYAGTLTTAKTLITRFGGSVTKTNPYDSSLWDKKYDPVTESFIWTNISSGATQISEPEDNKEVAYGVLVGISDELLENSLVKRSDSELLIIEISEPQIGNTFLVNGKEYNYVAHATVNPAGTMMLYKIALRV